MLPTGKRADALVGKVPGADQVEQFVDTRRAPERFGVDGEGDQVAAAHGQIRREHALLRDKPDAAVHADAAAREGACAQNGADEGGFTNAIWAQHGEEFAPLELEVQARPEGVDGGVAERKDHLADFTRASVTCSM